MPLLADDLVDGGERDPRLERQPERDRVAVVNMLSNRVTQRALLLYQWWLQTGARFSRKARMPSCAS